MRAVAPDAVAVALGVLGDAVVLGWGARVFTVLERTVVLGRGAVVFFGVLRGAVVLGFGVVVFRVLAEAVGVFDATGVGLLSLSLFQSLSQSASLHQPLAAVFSALSNCFPPLSRQSAQANATDGTPTTPMATAAMTIRR
jgi:hypothetical protein